MVNVSFQSPFSSGQGKVPVTLDVGTYVFTCSADGYLLSYMTCWRTNGKETKAYPTIRIPTNYANWGLPKQERHREVNNGYDTKGV